MIISCFLLLPPNHTELSALQLSACDDAVSRESNFQSNLEQKSNPHSILEYLPCVPRKQAGYIAAPDQLLSTRYMET